MEFGASSLSIQAMRFCWLGSSVLSAWINCGMAEAGWERVSSQAACSRTGSSGWDRL